MAEYQDDLVFLHALTDLPLSNVMKNTYLHNGVLAFPPRPCRQVANRSFQNHKASITRGSRSTNNKIEALLLEYAPVVEHLRDNCLDKLAEKLEAYKMSRNRKKTPQKGTSPFRGSAIAEEEEQDEFRDDVSCDESFYNNEGAVVSPL